MIQSKHGNKLLRSGLSGAWMVAALVAALSSVLILFAGILFNSPELTYTGMAILAFLMPAAVGALRGRDFDIFEPINLVALSVLVGTTLRAFYLITSHSAQAELLMSSTNFEEVNRNLPWILAGVAALCIGYISCPYKLRLSRFAVFKDQRFTVGGVWTATLVASAIGVIGLAMFISEFGISLSADILSQSFKRPSVIETDGEVVYAAGAAPFLASALQIAAIFLGVMLAARAISARRMSMALWAAVFLLSCVMPFFASSRSVIVVSIISICIAAYYFGRIRIRAILAVLAMLLVVVLGMETIRNVNNRAVNQNSVVDSLLGSGHGTDFVRTSAIMDRIPEVRPYQYGLSYIAIFASPIPRSVWPQKPDVSLGAWVKRELFGRYARKSGWPPGLIGEAYINFGRSGIIIVMLITGFLLRYFYESFRPLLGASVVATMIYARLTWELGFVMAGLNFSLSIVNVARFAIPALLLVWLAAWVSRAGAPARRQPTLARY